MWWASNVDASFAGPTERDRFLGGPPRCYHGNSRLRRRMATHSWRKELESTTALRNLHANAADRANLGRRFIELLRPPGGGRWAAAHDRGLGRFDDGPQARPGEGS